MCVRACVCERERERERERVCVCVLKQHSTFLGNRLIFTTPQELNG